MKALVYNRYGAAFHIAELPDPQPGPGQVIVSVRHVGLNAYDWRMWQGKPFLVRMKQGVMTPKNQILGADICGVVVGLGSGVRQWQVGDPVFGCLEGSTRSGLAAGGLATWSPSTRTALPSNLSRCPLRRRLPSPWLEWRLF
jgi:NADPH:quinone reductase-like Zn-dependent oxidoreductase